jgi:hypothetical protein
MTVRVYRFGALPPLDYELVREQLRGAHDYRNELTAIERGRRDAMRLIYDTPEIRDAEALLKQTTRSDRLAAMRALYTLRRETMTAAIDEAKRINTLAHEMQLGARALARCEWGTYLDVESAMQQSRGAPLYARGGIDPASPRFLRWREPMNGQIAVQIQSTRPLTTANAFRGGDTRVRVERHDAEHATLSLRVGSSGRAPIWARVLIKISRAIPDAASWKWVRVSVRANNWREVWSVEITVDDPAPRTRDLDTAKSGAIAVSWCWDPRDDQSIRVAQWHDTFGDHGEVILSPWHVKGIRKASDLRAVRDMIWNHLVIADRDDPTAGLLPRAIQRSRDKLPTWLREAGNTMHLWRSLRRAHDLARRWREERCDAARDAYEMLDAWEFGTHADRLDSRRSANGDYHLWEYETNVRSQSLGARRDFYRVLAAQWARKYAHALVSDHDLSREARFGDESDIRFVAAPDELRGALKNAFALDWIETKWDRKESWCERACAAYLSGGARGEMFAKRKEKTSNAWAARKKKKVENGTARKEAANAAE